MKAQIKEIRGEKVEDTAIINLYFDRSEEAIQATAQKYSRYCFSIAWNVLYDKDSDECVNDTWLATWNSIPPGRPTILSSFLGKITRNLAIDCFRRKSYKAVHRPRIRIMQRTGRNRRRNRVLFKWWDPTKRDSWNPWKVPGFRETRWPRHLHPALLVYGQHQWNFSPAWNFRKQSQIQPLSKQKETMGKGEAFIWKKDLRH